VNADPDESSFPFSKSVKVPSPGARSNYTEWDDVDLTVEQADCGRHKCFYPSIRHPDSIGYLIAKGCEYPYMARSQEIANDMAQRFGSKHFMLDTALDYVSTEIIDWMEDRVHQDNRETQGHVSTSIFTTDNCPPEYNFTFTAEYFPLTIQKVKLAPPALFFAVRRSNRIVYQHQLPDFLETVPDLNAFADQVEREIKRVARVLQAYPLLTHDFQLLFDGQGNAFHLDMDGALRYLDKRTPDQGKFKIIYDKMKELRDIARNWTPGSVISWHD
jgi:hypothetical protein